jgi:ribosomal-protein-alanine N-acetyltransferase
MRLALQRSVVRSWETADASSLVAHANNFKVAVHLRDRFPHPYTMRDARDFLRLIRRSNPETVFAIEVDGAAVGGIGFMLQQDVDRVSAEIGYWLGEPFWGRGIVTEALAALTTYGIQQHGLTRIFALPFAANTGSCRVLEKAGYVREALLRRAAIKHGEILDVYQYAFIAPDPLLSHTRETGQKR